MNVAKVIAQKINDDAQLRLVCMKPEYDTIDMGTSLIARAILAERERCAKIVGAFEETTTEGRAELEAAIRQPHP